MGFSPQQETHVSIRHYLGISSLLAPRPRFNMSDPWQECLDLCVEVTKKAGEVNEESPLCCLFPRNVYARDLQMPDVIK